MTDPTELDLAAIEARAEAATEGPWEHSLVGIDLVDDEYVVQTESVADVVCRLARSGEFIEHPMASAQADAEFIAHARTDVPALVARVRELVAERDSVQFALDGFRGVARAERGEEACGCQSDGSGRGTGTEGVERVEEMWRSPDGKRYASSAERAANRGWTDMVHLRRTVTTFVPVYGEWEEA